MDSSFPGQPRAVCFQVMVFTADASAIFIMQMNRNSLKYHPVGRSIYSEANEVPMFYDVIQLANQHPVMRSLHNEANEVPMFYDG
jgi:hypothetical protein